MKEITVQELKQKIENKEKFQLIDVREAYEYDICNIGGKLIPMGEIMDQIDAIRKDIPVVVHCRSGKRSAGVIDALQNSGDYSNLYNLAGGILAYAQEIDNSLEQY